MPQELNTPPLLARFGRLCLLLALDLQRDVDQLILLTADELALAGAVQQLMCGYAVPLGLADGVLEEARVHPRVAHDQRIAVEQALGGHRGGDHFLCRVGDVEEVDAGLDADLVEYADERLDGRVAGSRTESAARTVDLLGTGTNRLDRVGDAQTEVLVAVKSDLGIRSQFGDERLYPVTDAFEHQRACRVDDVDALAARVGHDARLLGELLRRDGVGHHQKAHGLQTQFAREPEVLDRHVGLGAVGGDPADGSAVVLGLLDVLLGADAGQHEEGDLGFLGRVRRDLDELLLGRLGKAVVEARSAQTVAVGHLDDRNTRGVERRHDRPDLVAGELMPLVVRPVAQRRVGHADVPDGVEEDVGGHDCAPSEDAMRTRSLAISSPTFVAAAVMMSRFPA
ncbi:hypothetical protein EB74_22580 [Mycobacterium sp. SWH-M5]|nr:hypothetical protein EB74_22580 [Mycobacterium sp. SWH-M5]